MRGYFSDADAYATMLAEEDVLLYKVGECIQAMAPGDLLYGWSIAHPGKVSDEYNERALSLRARDR